MNSKKIFILPKAEIIQFFNEDLILTSVGTEETASDDWSQNDGVENW